MANTKISALGSGTVPQAADEFVVARSGANYKLTWPQLFTAVPSITIDDANFGLDIVSSNPRITFDTGDYMEWNRAGNYLTLPPIAKAYGTGPSLTVTDNVKYTFTIDRWSGWAGNTGVALMATSGSNILALGVNGYEALRLVNNDTAQFLSSAGYGYATLGVGSSYIFADTSYGPQLNLYNHSNDASGPYYVLSSVRGTKASPAATQAGDALGTLLWQGWGGGANNRTGSAHISVVTTGTLQGSSPNQVWPAIMEFAVFDLAGAYAYPLKLEPLAAGAKVTLMNDANFNLYLSGGHPTMALDSGDYWLYNRTSNALLVVIGNATRHELGNGFVVTYNAGSVRHWFSDTSQGSNLKNGFIGLNSQAFEFYKANDDFTTGLTRLAIITSAGQIKANSAAPFGSDTTCTNGAGAGAGTLTNAPAAGNPTKWVPFDDNGTTRYIPMW